MEHGSTGYDRAAQALIAALGAFHVWKAATASVTTDEAFTFNAFVDPPLREVMNSYDANHHVLHSLLCKLATGAFGVSELTLRLVSVAAGIVFVWLTYRTARAWFGPGALMVGLTAWVGLHPTVFDFLSLARGYSLALALWMAAVHELTARKAARARLASVWMGLSVAANLVFLVPCGGLIAGYAWWRRDWRVVERLIVPGATVAFVILAAPLRQASRSNYYYGVADVRESLASVVGVPQLPGVSVAMVFAFALSLAAGVALARRRHAGAAIATATLLCVAGIATMHFAANVPWPRGRTGIYVPVLFGMALSWLLHDAGLARAGWGLAAAAVVFATRVETTQYRDWPWDRRNREVFAELMRRGEARRPQVTAQFPLQHGMEFYRRRMGRRGWPRVREAGEGGQGDFVVVQSDAFGASVAE
jgi:hypothetical protein